MLPSCFITQLSVWEEVPQRISMLTSGCHKSFCWWFVILQLLVLLERESERKIRCVQSCVAEFLFSINTFSLRSWANFSNHKNAVWLNCSIILRVLLASHDTRSCDGKQLKGHSNVFASFRLFIINHISFAVLLTTFHALMLWHVFLSSSQQLVSVYFNVILNPNSRLWWRWVVH